MAKSVALKGRGGEKKKYLSHAHAKLWLQKGYKGDGERWIMHEISDGVVAF